MCVAYVCERMRGGGLREYPRIHPALGNSLCISISLRSVSKACIIR